MQRYNVSGGLEDEGELSKFRIFRGAQERSHTHVRSRYTIRAPNKSGASVHAPKRTKLQ